MVKGTEEKEWSLSEWLQIPALANVVLKEKDKRRVLSGKKTVVTTVVTTVYFIFFPVLVWKHQCCSSYKCSWKNLENVHVQFYETNSIKCFPRKNG